MLLDNVKADQPERRTALVARELSHRNNDIAALRETLLPDKGQLTEIGSGQAFFGVDAEVTSDAKLELALPSEPTM